MAYSPPNSNSKMIFNYAIIIISLDSKYNIPPLMHRTIESTVETRKMNQNFTKGLHYSLLID